MPLAEAAFICEKAKTPAEECPTFNLDGQVLSVRLPTIGECARPGPCVWEGHRFNCLWWPCKWTPIWPLPLNCRARAQTVYLTLERYLAAWMQFNRGVGGDWRGGQQTGGKVTVRITKRKRWTKDFIHIGYIDDRRSDIKTQLGSLVGFTNCSIWILRILNQKIKGALHWFLT